MPATYGIFLAYPMEQTLLRDPEGRNIHDPIPVPLARVAATLIFWIIRLVPEIDRQRERGIGENFTAASIDRSTAMSDPGRIRSDKLMQHR